MDENEPSVSALMSSLRLEKFCEVHNLLLYPFKGGAAGSPGVWCCIIDASNSRIKSLIFATVGAADGYALAMPRSFCTTSMTSCVPC
jgi:hypothetical protein